MSMHTSAVVREDQKQVELFSPTAIAVISFFFSAATGCLLLAYNNWQLRRDYWGFIAAAVVGLPVMIVVYTFLPSFVTLLINVGLIYWMRTLANDQESDARFSGHGVSAMNALVGVGIGVVVLIIALVLAVAIGGALAG